MNFAITATCHNSYTYIIFISFNSSSIQTDKSFLSEISDNRTYKGRCCTGTKFVPFTQVSHVSPTRPERASPWVLMDANLSLCKDKSFQIPGNIHSFCPSIENLPSSFLLLNGGILSVFPRFNIFNKQLPFIFCLHVSRRCISIFKR